MFQFPGLHSRLTGYPDFIWMGYPIRTSRDQGSFAPPPGFSQLTTSFVSSKSLGIHHTPFFRFQCLYSASSSLFVILSIRIYRSLYTCSLLSHPVNELPGYFPRLHTLPLATSVQYPVDNLLFLIKELSFKNCGGSGIRTQDPLRARQVL